MELEILTAKLCQICTDVNHASADQAVDYLTLAQNEVLKLQREDRVRDLYRKNLWQSAPEDYDWLAHEFKHAWE
ncbi:hypothetical protein [Chroococcidiopsis sp.]|uniref:hypothetical protein n=1 Tax=Chroococcidiopsis sp. TaxID=3088168 RepID=UPI003F2E3179